MSLDERAPAKTTNHLTAQVVHDLADALGAAKVAADALDQPQSPGPRTKQHLALLQRSLRRMARLVGDVRSIADGRPSRFSVAAVASIAPQTLVAAALEVARPQAAGHRFQAACAPDLPDVRVDEDRVEQVFANLIGNAIKFSPSGTIITVGAERTNGDSAVAFFVHNEGDGISEAAKELIFEPFWRGHPEQYVGSGLGLTICRGIVEAHGGTITCSSRTGEGTTFRFTLPAAGFV